MRRAALLLVGLVLSVSGCDAHVEAVVGEDRQVKLEATIWDHVSLTAEGSTQAQCATYETAAIGLTQEELVDPNDPTRRGCRITGTTSLEQVRAGVWGPVLMESQGTIILGIPANQVTAWTQYSDGVQRSSTIDLSVTFPGPVTYHDNTSTVEGTTVRWHDTTGVNGLGFQAIALADPGLPPSWWTVLAVAGCTVGGAVATGGVLWWRHKRRAHSESPDAEPATAADDPWPTDAAASDLGWQPSVTSPGLDAPTLDEDPSVWAPDADR